MYIWHRCHVSPNTFNLWLANPLMWASRHRGPPVRGAISHHCHQQDFMRRHWVVLLAGGHRSSQLLPLCSR